MKNPIKTTTSALLLSVMMFLVTACGENVPKNPDVSTNSSGGTATTDAIFSDVTSDSVSSGTGISKSDVSGSASSRTSHSSTSQTKTSNLSNLTWEQVKAKIPASLKGTTITMYSWNAITDVTGAATVAKNFTKETGIKVDWQVGSYTNYHTEISARIAGKNAPDIIRLQEAMPAALALLQPLSASGYDFNDQAWDKQVMDYYSVNGKSYATNLTDTLIQLPNVIYYNKALINQFDLDDPYAMWKKGKWTWGAMEKLLRDFKSEAGKDFIGWSPVNWLDYCASTGVNIVEFDGKNYVNKMSDQKLVAGFQYISKLYNDGLTSTRKYDRAPFDAGKLLLYTDSIISARKAHFGMTSMKANGTLGIVPLPSVEGQSTYYQTFIELEAYGTPQGAKNAAAVPFFLRYYLDAANYDINSFFSDRTMLDVYKNCMAQKARIPTHLGFWIITDNVGLNFTQITDELRGAAAAQIPSILQQRASVVDLAVKQANQKISNLK